MKNKNSTKILVKKSFSNLGLAIMTLATVVGMLELPGHYLNNRYILPGQLVRFGANNLNDITNPIRREKEETNPDYISYNESQRSPSRSGKY